MLFILVKAKLEAVTSTLPTRVWGGKSKKLQVKNHHVFSKMTIAW